MARPPGPGLLAARAATFAALRRPHRVAQDLYRRYGPIVRLGRGSAGAVMLFGPRGNEVILSGPPEEFTWREAMQIVGPVIGPTALPMTDGDEHDQRRLLVEPACAAQRLDWAVPIAVEEFDAAIDVLVPGTVVDLHPIFRRTVQRIMARVLLGASPPEQVTAFGSTLEPAVRHFDRIPMRQFRGSPGYLAARRARRAADRLVDAELQRRRDLGEPGHDILGALSATDLSDAEIRDQMVSLFAAGYDTTSAAGAWTLLELLRTPGMRHRARGDVEQRVGAGGRPPDAEDLRHLPFVGAAVNESLRLWPPGSLSGRRSTETFEFEGYSIKAGSFVLFSPYVTHRMREVWGPDAPEFRPDRWFEHEPLPFSFIPFGGPNRPCIGSTLAQAHLQVAVARLVQRTTLRLVDPERVVLGRGISALVPEGGVPVWVDEVR